LGAQNSEPIKAQIVWINISFSNGRVYEVVFGNVASPFLGLNGNW
jgi:hypothetical protein